MAKPRAKSRKKTGVCDRKALTWCQHVTGKRATYTSLSGSAFIGALLGGGLHWTDALFEPHRAREVLLPISKGAALGALAGGGVSALAHAHCAKVKRACKV